MNVESVFHLFNQRLANSKLLPWWELVRGFLNACMVGLLAYVLTVVDYDRVVCLKNETMNGITMTSMESDFVNSICKTKLPWSSRKLGFWMGLFIIFHLCAEKWWLSIPRIKNTISAVGEINRRPQLLQRAYLRKVIQDETEIPIYLIRCIVLIIVDIFSLSLVPWYPPLVYENLINCNASGNVFNGTEFICSYEAYDLVKATVYVTFMFLWLSLGLSSFEVLGFKQANSNYVAFFYDYSEKKEELGRELNEILNQ
ncbi:uncharacterized protein LOC108950001 [Ciona intestinalis]